jgi:hypothetical protein
MARAQGARAQMALAFETEYGLRPPGGYNRINFASSSLAAGQPLLASELLGYGRDPVAPVLDAVTLDGDIVIPIDQRAIGIWLAATFGVPVTTGGEEEEPFVHSFASGAWDLPSMSIEVGMPDVPHFAVYSGCMVDQLSWTMQRSGLLTATVRVIAQGEDTFAASQAGEPVAIPLARFGHFNGSIRRNGQQLANVVSADISYQNNLDRVETIRGDGKIDGADPSMAAMTGRIDVRFADRTLVEQAIAGEPCEIEFGYASVSGASLTFRLPAVYLPRPRLELSGPGGVQATFEWQAAQAAGESMVQVTLVNDVEAY